MRTIPASTQEQLVQTAKENGKLCIEQGAEFDHYLVGGCGQLEVEVMNEAVYRPFLLSDKSDNQTTSLTIRLHEKAETDLKALLIATGKQEIQADITIIHTAPDAVSEQLTKTLADDQAKIRLTTTVKIDNKAVHATARQMAKNLILSEKAEIITEPKMEIDTDAVQASHGSSTGTLDPKTLFYLQARGISKEEAKKLLVHAFIDEMNGFIELPELKQSIREQIPA